MIIKKDFPYQGNELESWVVNHNTLMCFDAKDCLLECLEAIAEQVDKFNIDIILYNSKSSTLYFEFSPKVITISNVPDLDKFRELIEEGQKLSRQFDKDTAGMRIFTDEELKLLSKSK